MGRLSATLSPQLEQPRWPPVLPTAILGSAAFISATVNSTAVAVDIKDNNADDPLASFDAPSPPSCCCVPPSLATTCKLHCSIHHCPSQVRLNGRGRSQAAPPTHQVGNAPVNHGAGAGKDLVQHRPRPPSLPCSCPEEQLVQLPLQLHSLPRVGGCDDLHCLA